MKKSCSLLDILRILDSFSDGAKARQAAAISEIEITVPGDGSADTVEAAGTTEEQETPGVIEEVPENPQPEEIPERRQRCLRWEAMQGLAP